MILCIVLMVGRVLLTGLRLVMCRFIRARLCCVMMMWFLSVWLIFWCVVLVSVFLIRRVGVFVRIRRCRGRWFVLSPLVMCLWYV